MNDIHLEQISRVIHVNRTVHDINVKNVQRDYQVNTVGRRGPTGLTGATGPTGPQGPPGSDATDKNFVEVFTNSSEVTVTHSLNKFPAVTITNSAGDEVEGEVEHVSVNQLIARFSASFTGKLVCNQLL